MTADHLVIGSIRYDTTQALFDGEVGVEGAEVEMRTAATVPELFRRVLVDREFDVAELGMTFYARTLTPESPYVALPVFPNRIFRHSSVFVHVGSGVDGPADLVGRRIGEFGMYSQDSGVWAKGVLMDEYGFRPGDNRWVIGGLDRPAPPFDFVPQTYPADLDLQAAPAGAALGPMLDAGEIDVLFTANVPQCVLDGSPNVRRLFVDHEPVERDYFRRTGIFPMMHTVVARRELVEGRPDLARRVYRAFSEAKDRAQERYRRQARLFQVQTAMPWMNALVERNLLELPADPYAYGIAANRVAIEANLRHQQEQGVIDRAPTVEEAFAAALLDT